MKLFITKKQLIFLVLFLLPSFLLFQSCDNSKSEADQNKENTIIENDFFKKYSANQQQEDLKVLKESLEKIHPDLYWHVSKDDFEKEFDILLSGINKEKTSYQFAFYIRNLFATIR